MKKITVLAVSFFIVLGMAIIPSDTLRIDNELDARDGTCCEELDSLCIVGTNQLMHKYYKSEGSCNEVGESD